MPGLGVAPDAQSFNAAIRAVGRARDPALAPRLRQLYAGVAAAGLRADKYTFSALFGAAHHCCLEDGAFLLQARCRQPALVQKVQPCPSTSSHTGQALLGSNRLVTVCVH